MITGISIRNFRSIEADDIALAPITVLYGPTSSGKSSLLYATLVLRNFVVNPNRQADGFFHLGFMDLGGFDACVFNHETKRSIDIKLSYARDGTTASYGLSLSRSEGVVHLNSGTVTMQGKVPIPYGLNLSFSSTYMDGDEEYAVSWNGIACTVSPKKPTAETQQRAQEIATSLNASNEVVSGIDIAPHRRGFFKPNYAPAAVSTIPTTEDEVASIIINDPHMQARISVYTEEIFGRDFRWYIAPGTATAYFLTTEKKSRVPVYLVNDGHGVNQVIYMLAKMHRIDIRTVLIEEPEVHLHPTVLRNFARALCTFIREENKQVILTTHSELFLTSLLAAVAEGLMRADEIKCHLATRDGKSTLFKEQKVHENGQIEGGLSSFVEGEIEDLKKFLGVR
jgi:predicted ATPase